MYPRALIPMKSILSVNLLAKVPLALCIGEPIGNICTFDFCFYLVQYLTFYCRSVQVAVKVLARQNELLKAQTDEFLKYTYFFLPVLCSLSYKLFLCREIELMNKLRSPYIVNFIGASYVPGKLCVVTEFMEKGSVARIFFKDVYMFCSCLYVLFLLSYKMC